MDELVVTYGAAAAVFAALLLVVVITSRLRYREMSALSRKLGGVLKRGTSGGTIRATVSGVDLEIRYRNDAVEIDARDSVPATISLRRRTDERTASEYRSGDPDLDNAVSLDGDRERLAALLDRETRRALAKLLGHSKITVRAGTIHLEETIVRSRDGLTATEAIENRIARVVALAGWLSVESPGLSGLERNAEEDPVAGVRLRNLLCLQEEHPESAATERAIVKALADKDPSVRLCAAWGTDREAAIKVARGVLDSAQASESVRRQALKLLSEKLERADAIVAATAALADPFPGVQLDAITWLSRMDASEAREAIAACQLTTSELKSAAIEALSKFRGPEEPFIALLRDESASLRVSAANALAAFGTTAAVPALHEGGKGLFTPTRVEQACEQAVAAIKARAAGAGAGQLALAADEVGDLSLPASEGDLAIVQAEDPDDPETTRPRRRAQKTTA